jgi:hypothetical protein
MLPIMKMPISATAAPLGGDPAMASQMQAMVASSNPENQYLIFANGCAKASVPEFLTRECPERVVRRGGSRR